MLNSFWILIFILLDWVSQYMVRLGFASKPSTKQLCIFSFLFLSLSDFWTSATNFKNDYSIFFFSFIA